VLENATRPNPTHGWTQPMSISGLSVPFAAAGLLSWAQRTLIVKPCPQNDSVALVSYRQLILVLNPVETTLVGSYLFTLSYIRYLCFITVAARCRLFTVANLALEFQMCLP